MIRVQSPSSAAAVAAALLLLLAAATGADAESCKRVVRTRQGAVRGTAKHSYQGRPFLAFYNIPFARPPVGPLRFRSPQPPAPWIHVRDATSPGPACTQNSLLEPLRPPIGTEDCLYLNVFTPELKPAKLLPVMVWIHGGGFVEGAATWYEPDFLLDHEIVLVTTNYRVGPLGFLNTGDENAPGNYGLKDQVAALKWVKDNVEAFGGDPNSVTIFGESAGGASVHYLMLSPLARGLFHRAISQSGVSTTPWAAPQPGALDKARKVAAMVGCPTEPNAALVDCLRTVDDYTLTGTEMTFLEWFICPLIPFRAAVEGDGEDSFLPKHPGDMEPHTAVPWLTGVTIEEGYFHSAPIIANKTLLRELKENSKRLLPISVPYHLLPQADLINEKTHDFYFSRGFSNDKITEFYSDSAFIWPAVDAVGRYKDRAPVYFYLFSYKGKYKLTDLAGSEEISGVAHGDDLLYLFSNNSYYMIPGERPAKDMEVVKAMTKLWTNFAKTGNPTPNDELIHWPRVTSDTEPEYLEIGEKLEAKKGLVQERMELWRSLPLTRVHQKNVEKQEL
ncbi:juvenile hormone esterase-like isoform X4 [Schistocerca gregaria]|uniref:juvenile hormone esterase-like isoform X4 n=1 Tax=Schistocerca gregaria TaxID=7010 RepID=UPI00211ED053|nr:juvenile hormone esterase-like isoform X4 [Schistocerca gregaria]